jgi:tRNA (guanine-N7-)-methyltransferase
MRDVTQGQGTHDLRSYGRRRGRALSARQKTLWQDLLPRVALPREAEALHSLPALFTPPVREVWLEIGFGDGAHLLWQAEHNPDIGIIGCEPFVDGVVKVLSALEAKPRANVRLYAEDARALLRWLPPGSIGRVFVLFPDPWPKRRHTKRRLLGPGTLASIARCLRPGAELRIATDSGDYVRTILLAATAEPRLVWQAASPEQWRRRSSDWPATKYERKATAERCKCYFMRLLRR